MNANFRVSELGLKLQLPVWCGNLCFPVKELLRFRVGVKLYFKLGLPLVFCQLTGILIRLRMTTRIKPIMPKQHNNNRITAGDLHHA